MKKRTIISLCILILAYFITRLIHLTIMPIFTDEAIYLWWAKIGLLDNSQRFISLTDGKQPLLIWMFTLTMKFIPDPLLAGRLTSVLMGSIGLTGMFFAGREIFKNNSVGLWSTFLYLISPFFLVYDRLALYDSLVAAITVWSIYLIVVLVRRVRLDIALILGWVLGVGMLTKTNTVFNIFLLPASFILLSKKINLDKQAMKWLLLAFLASLMAIVMYNLLRLSPWFYIIGRKNEEFIYPIHEWIRHPIQYFLPNLQGLTKWLNAYLTPPLIALAASGVIVCGVFRHERFFLFWAFIFPFISLTLFGKVLFPRFLLSMVVPFYILMSFVLFQITLRLKNKVILALLFLTLFLKPIITDFHLLFDPVNAELPDSERQQFLDDWPSGYGVFEVRDYIKQEVTKHDIYLATEGTFGMFPAAFELYFVGDPRVQTHGYWPVNDDTMKELGKIAKTKPTFIVFKETLNIPDNWPLQKVFEIRRGKGLTYLRFYKVVPGN